MHGRVEVALRLPAAFSGHGGIRKGWWLKVWWQEAGRSSTARRLEGGTALGELLDIVPADDVPVSVYLVNRSGGGVVIIDKTYTS